MNTPTIAIHIDNGLGVPKIIGPGFHSGDSGQSGSDSEHHTKKGGTTATPNRVKRRSRAARRSTGIMPSEADLDTPDKVSEMGGLLGLTTPTTPQTAATDPLAKAAAAGPPPVTSLLVPEAHVYKVPAKKNSPSSKDRIGKLNKDLSGVRQKIEENDCMLIQGLEELRRKDLNVRALEKTQSRLENTLTQLQSDVAKLLALQAENEKITKENASLIRVIGKLSNKAGRRGNS